MDDQSEDPAAGSFSPPPLTLWAAIQEGAGARPRGTAVEESSGDRITYRQLWALAQRVAGALSHLGVGPGDRVGIYLPKSIDAIAAILGVLRSGAAYVPVDPESPVARASTIIEDCSLACLIATAELLGNLQTTLPVEVPALVLPDVGGGRGLTTALERGIHGAPVAVEKGPQDLAYVLYTSGSTGKPKGVMLSHRNAVSFLDWCGSVFRPTTRDRFVSHAPLHFDLSVLDVFLSLRHGSTLVLLAASEGRNPRALAETIERLRISSWYSAPSILSMLAQFGQIEERDWRSMQRVLFAGEVFPVKHLRRLRELLPGRAFFNLYGPTETNVCTWYRIPDNVPPERKEPYPIGRICPHFRARVVDESGSELSPGAEGELCVSGSGVMLGYWNRPEETARAFLCSDTERWYRTGDLVRATESGDYEFIGRRDRMVKRRGYRIELGEIEASLYRHPDIREVAVVPLPGEDGAVRIRAALGVGSGERPTIVQLKAFCASALPSYMIPDEFVIRTDLPKTSTAKVDLQKIAELEV